MPRLATAYRRAITSIRIHPRATSVTNGAPGRIRARAAVCNSGYFQRGSQIAHLSLQLGYQGISMITASFYLDLG